jgi:hypothetical protein
MSIGGTRISNEQAVFAFGIAAGVGTGLGQFIFSNKLSNSAADSVSISSVLVPFGLAAAAPLVAPFLLDAVGN